MTIYHDRQPKASLASRQLTLTDTASGVRSGTSGASWFKTIPPERIGVNGEYDYYGLQKRVERAFQEQIEPQHWQGLSVGQRGRVVILSGHIPNEETLWHLVAIAEGIEGVTRVEVAGVGSNQPYAERNCKG